MEIGMLWGLDGQGLADAIVVAGRYYFEKYGAVPDMCFVNAGDLAKSGGRVMLDRVRVDVSQYVCPGTIWIGVGNTNHRKGLGGMKDEL